MAYKGLIYLGAPESQGPFEIVFDTGSDKLAVMSRNCPTCPKGLGSRDYYDEFMSMASVSPNNWEAKIDEQYGSAKITGHPITDSVCLTPIDLRKKLAEKRESYEISAGQEVDLSKIDLSGEEDQELKSLLELVDKSHSCIPQFPVLSIEE